MTNDMKLLLRAVDSWKWPATFGSITGVICGIYVKEVVPQDAAIEVIRLVCGFMAAIMIFLVTGIYTIRALGGKTKYEL